MAETEEVIDAAIQMGDQLNDTMANKEETKENAKQEISTTKSEIMNELFYVYYKHKITGPHYHDDILKKYIGKQIEKEIWVKNVKDANKKNEWYKIDLSYKEIEENNKELNQKFPKLYYDLILKIKSESIKQCQVPFDFPKADMDEISFGTQMIQILGKIIAVLISIIIVLHIIGTACFSFCCFAVFYLINGDNESNKDDVAVGAMFIAACLGFIIMPPIMVYVVLLDAIDYDDWNGEIQSWMISYIAWGIFTFSFVAIWWIAQTKFNIEHKGTAKGTSGFAGNIFQTVFWVIGVEFHAVDMQSLYLEASWAFTLSMVFLFPALAALLPSAIIGFIANFVLEEKFELKCGDEILNDTLCFDDGYGCCQVISSHDVRNTYAFIGGLASNILATWAFIRIIGYLVVNINVEASMFAKRNK